MKTEDNMNVNLELAGYPCRITHILARTANPTFARKEDFLVVVEFSKPSPAAIISTSISIPVKDYSKDEFIEVVQKNGDEQIAASVERHHQDDERKDKKEQRQAELDVVAHGIEAKFK